MNHNTLSGGQFYMFKGNSRFISIMLCVLLCLQTLPMEVFASQQVSEDTRVPTKSMYLTLQELQTQNIYLPNVGNSYGNNELSDDASFAFAKMVFSYLYKPVMSPSENELAQDYTIEEHSSVVGELSNQSFGTSDVKLLMQQAKMGDIIQAHGANKENHYMIFMKATQNSVLVYDCDFAKDSKDYIREYYLYYDEWVSYFGQADEQGTNGIKLLRADNYLECYGSADLGYYDDSLNFTITDNVVRSYSGNQTIVVIPDTVRGLGNNPFKGNESLHSVVIPRSTTYIGPNAFENCLNLMGIDLPESISKIYGYAFCNCTNMAFVSLSSKITQIGERSFQNCDQIRNLILPLDLSSLGYGAYMDCDNLESVFVPSALGDNAAVFPIYGYFENCPKLQSVYYEEGIRSIPAYLFYRASIEEIVVPESVTCIRARAFGMNSSLKSVTLPSHLVSIEERAFAGCDKITQMDVPDSVTSIGVSAFAYCSKLEKIKLPDSLITLEKEVLRGNDSLVEVQMPSNLLHIKESAFMGCTSLASIELPKSLRTIGEGAFRYCQALTCLELPQSVDQIAKEAFYGCANLRTISIGSGIQEIKESMFASCYDLQKIVVPYSVHTIDKNAFSDCMEMTEIYIPETVHTIDASAFYLCVRLTIYGKKDSAAIAYAKAKGIKYKVLEESSIVANQVRLYPSTLSLSANEIQQLQLAIIPTNCTQTITWSSSDEAIATVSSNGYVMGIASGTATISAKVGDKESSCQVIVREKIVSIDFDEPKMEMEALDTAQIPIQIVPDSIPRDLLEWSSSDESIASVDSQGVVSAKKKGSVTIEARAKDGSGLFDTCLVDVMSDVIKVKTLDDLQSSHPYSNNSNIRYDLTKKGAKEISVSFGQETSVEMDQDVILIYNKANQVVGKYTGTQLAGKTVKVKGDTLKIRLQTDGQGVDYGIKVIATTPQLPVIPTTLKLNKTNIKMLPNTNTLLKATVLPNNSIDKSVRWESSNDSVLGVRNGVLSAHGIGEATITAYTNSGDLKATCDVEVSKVVNELCVKAIHEAVYSGKQLKPKVAVYDGETLLTLNQDYKIQYKNNVKVGTIYSKNPPTAVITGIGNYNKTVTTCFDIVPMKISSADILMSIQDQVYSGKQKIAIPVIQLGTKKLVKNQDYTLQYVDSEKTNLIGRKEDSVVIQVIVTGKGNFSGSKTINYQIVGKTIANASIQKIPNQIYQYDGIMPELTVTYKSGGKITTLKPYDPATKEGNYKVTYYRNVDVGKAKVVISGKNGFGGTKTTYFKILPRPITDSDFVFAEIGEHVYSKDGVVPKPHIYNNHEPVHEGEDYTLSYKYNRSARAKMSKYAPTVVIKGKGNFNGTKTIKFTIVPKSISDNDISIDVQNALYNPSKAAKGKVIIKEDGKLLKENRDYKLFYADNADLGPATVRIQGIGNYEGETTATYQVLEPILVTDAKVVVQEIADATYSGKAIKPSISVSYNGTILRENIDYKVRFANNIKVAQSSSSKPPTVKITGIGTFQGSLVKTFSIVPHELSDERIQNGVITVTTTDLLYSAGKPRYSKVSVKVGSKVLVKDVDYTLSYANVTQVADVDDPNPPTVTITGKGNYSGSLERNYRIYAKDIGTMSYSKITSLIYTGKELKPSVMIKDKAANTVLVEGTDYTIAYTKNTSVGTGSAIITGIGTYGGTKKIRFIILPKIFKWFF